MAKRIFLDKKKLFRSKLNLEFKIFKCLVWSVALCSRDVDKDQNFLKYGSGQECCSVNSRCSRSVDVILQLANVMSQNNGYGGVRFLLLL